VARLASRVRWVSADGRMYPHITPALCSQEEREKC